MSVQKTMLPASGWILSAREIKLVTPATISESTQTVTNTTSGQDAIPGYTDATYRYPRNTYYAAQEHPTADFSVSAKRELWILGSAREFGETANWRTLERFALPGISGDRITCLGSELVRALP